jgi:ribonuclease VapC
MIVDTSALIAIVQDEPERPAFIEALDAAESCTVSAAILVETSIVIDARYGAEGVRALDLLLLRAEVEVAPVDADQALLARIAFQRFGKGRHPAGLNFGDCFSYALARAYAEPLLFKGGDFSQTDVEIHPASR